MAAVQVFQWSVDTTPFTDSAIWCAAMAAGLWANGHFMHGSLHRM
jgi:hypothetical protein